jgi:CheY-like chemotaxis protein
MTTALSPQSKRILIADDNRDSAESMALLLQLDGHEVVVENDGFDALVTFDRFKPHVVVLDIGMPGLSGYEVASMLRSRSRDVLLVAITGWGREDDKLRAQAAGFDHHLTKPVQPEDLAKVLAGSR